MGRNFTVHPGFFYWKRTYGEPRASIPRIKVVLAHGQGLFREGLRHILEREADIQVAGHAADGVEAAELCRLLVPDVLIMDLALPPAGLKGVRGLLSHTPRPRLLLLASAPKVKEVREAISEGVDGILLEDCDGAELARSVRALYKGERSPRLKVAQLGAGKANRLALPPGDGAAT